VTVSLLLLNVHKEEAALEWLAEQKADLTLVNEANRAPRPGRVAPTYLTGPDLPGRNTQRDCGIGVRGLPMLGHTWERISENAGGEHEALAPDRYAQRLFTKIEGEDTDVYCVHLNAGPSALRGTDRDHPIVREYRQSLRWLRTSLRTSERLGRHFIVGGDVNLREHEVVPWSPYHVFDEFGMSFHEDGLDVLAVSEGLRMTDRRVYPRNVVHSDHPGIGAEIGVR
jgi:hypothetical protein